MYIWSNDSTDDPLVIMITVLGFFAFIGGIALVRYGTILDTKEKSLQYLLNKDKVEIKIDKLNRPYYALKDSTYIELFKYLND